MKEEFKIAWRNLWRNKRRTLITAASIFFGVLFSAYMSSMQEGSYENMVRSIVQFYSGHLQVHHPDYWDDKTINNTFEYTQTLKDELAATAEIEVATPRLESFALASSTEITKGVMVLGIQPKTEQQVTKLADKIIRGEYLQPGDSGVIMGSAMARYLKLDVGDTLVLISQGYHGVAAAGKYRIKGIIKHPSPEFDRMLVCMDLPLCQEFFAATNLLTSVVMLSSQPDQLSNTRDGLLERINGEYSAMTWDEMNPIMLQQIESDRISAAIMKGILYMVIGFGILGTVIMMVMERKRELGVMVALGMQRTRLASVLAIESIFIGLIGVVFGVLASIPLNYFFYINPIPLSGQAAEFMLQYGFEPVMFFSMTPSVFYHQALTVFILTLIISIYPVAQVFRLKIQKAMRA